MCKEIMEFLAREKSINLPHSKMWLFGLDADKIESFTGIVKDVYLGNNDYTELSYYSHSDAEKCLDVIRQRNDDKEIGDFVFWHLLALAVDDDLWENHVSDVTEVAYCLGFDSLMIRDWCMMVKYVLEGNELGAHCGLPVKTERGRKYFHVDKAA